MANETAMKAQLLVELDSTEEYFLRSIRCLREQDSLYRPVEGMFTVAQHVAHCAHTAEWFLAGMENPKGFDMDFEEHWRQISESKSLEMAREWFTEAVYQMKERIDALTEAELLVPLPEGPVLGGAPRHSVVGALVDHTAHHRGALTVYSRLLGLSPLLPYIELPE
jgi:uncharacterized damage-inducible protein DinB